MRQLKTQSFKIQQRRPQIPKPGFRDSHNGQIVKVHMFAQGLWENVHRILDFFFF